MTLAAAALAGGLGARRAARPPLERIVLGDLRQPATSLTFVAQEAGCFAREGLEVEARTFELGRDALVALTAGELDVAIAYDAPVLRAYARDSRLRALSMLHTSTRNTRLVARSDRGVRRVADLRGKRIGAAMGTNAEFLVHTLLTFGAIPRRDVTLVDLAPERAAAALASGAVDAVALSDPHAERAHAAAGAAAVEITTELYAEFSLLVTRAPLVAARSAALEALLRGLACAERALAERPAESYAAVRSRFPERGDAELRAALGRVSRQLGLDGRVSSILRRQADWLTTSYAVRPMPEVSTLLAPALLDRVEPEAVNLVGLRSP